jgi:TetR/AcrR family tetracycline transcriptional repressor
MRRLAAELDVRAGAIYWHFADKQDLVDAMTDQLLAGVLDRPLRGAWDKQLAELCRRLVTGMLSRRDAARLMTLAVKPGPNGLAVSEAMLRIARGAGLPKQTTLWGTAVLGYYVLGYVTDVQATQAAMARGLGATLKELKKQIRRKTYPELASLGPDALERLMTGAAFRRRFEFGLEIILRGLRAERRRRATRRLAGASRR